MKYNFDIVHDRRRSGCYKYDTLKMFFGRDDVLSMWVADMDFAVAPEIQEALQQRLNHPVFGYNFRLDNYYEAIIRWVELRYKWKIEKEWIVSTPGVVPAINLAILSYTNQGDHVLIQTPAYQPFFKAVLDHDRKLLTNTLVLVDGEYRIDFEDFETKIRKSKLFILCNPHNPTGKVFTAQELIHIGELCEKYKVPIVSDEIHADLVFESFKHVSIASFTEFRQLVITCISPSKSFNLAGLCTSAIIIPDTKLQRPFYDIVDKLHLYMGNSFGIAALIAAYTLGENWLNALKKYLQCNRDIICDFLRNLNSTYHDQAHLIGYTIPQSTYLMWLDFRSFGFNDEQLFRKTVDEMGIAFDPGTKFGTDGSGFMRLNFGCPKVIVKEALNRIEKYVEMEI